MNSWLKFAADSMPDATRDVEVLWHNRDGAEVILREEAALWWKYVALYGYPDCPRWRYAT